MFTMHGHGPHGRHMHGHGPRGRGFGPPGWEFFGGFGRFGKRGPRRNRGDIRNAVLALLREQPMHGYQIINEIGERTDGAWTPSPGSVYPTISQLADEGLVYTEKSEGRTVVHLTERGRDYVEQHGEELDSAWRSAAPPTDDASAELRTAGQSLMGAVVQVAQVGNADQLAEATRLLNDTRRRLYLLLAGETPDDSGDSRS